MLNIKWLWTHTLLFVSISCYGQREKLVITSLSTENYSRHPDKSIYPGFADGMPYQSWTKKGSVSFYQLTAEGKNLPFKWTLVQGKLPDGISLTENGKLSGTPVREGKFSFTVQVNDSKGNSTSKLLSFTINPPRSQWLSDAKFGLWLPFGPYIVPKAQTKEEITVFEKQLTKFNADEWVSAVVDMGGKILNVSAKAGDGIRMWPSKTPSVHELKLSRNIIKELVVAAHKKGIKLIASFAPDHTWNSKVNDTAIDGTWGTLNIGLVRELIEMGVDGLWVDMGGTPELFPDHVDPKWFPWNEILSMARTLNPGFIFSNNPGLEHGGAALRWPDTDVLVYEGYTGLEENSLVTAKPSILEKRVAIEANNLLDSSWAWMPNMKPKPANMIIKNIQANWDVGATYMLVIPVAPDGQIHNNTYLPILSKIGEFVRENQKKSPVPAYSLNKDKVYTSPQTISLQTRNKSKIYFTTDGSTPTLKSTVYTSPIKLTKTTQIKSFSQEKGKDISNLTDHTFFFYSKSSKSKFARQAYQSKKNENTPITDKRNYYRGMKIVIGPTPITLEEIGRRHVKGNENIHSILITTFIDNSPVLTSELDTKLSDIENDGFQYIKIPPVTLKAGVAYIIACKEDSSDLYIPGKSKERTQSDYFRIPDLAILNSTGDRFPITDDGNGTHINFKYNVGDGKKSKNIALGADVSFVGKKDNPLPAWMGRYFVENAVDGDPLTRAQPGGEYSSSFKVDFGRVQKKIKQIIVDFPSDGYATEIRLSYSIDGINWKLIKEITDNSALHMDIAFTPIDARYLKFTAVKPDGPGQKGNGMGIWEFKVFQQQ